MRKTPSGPGVSMRGGGRETFSSGRPPMCQCIGEVWTSPTVPENVPKAHKTARTSFGAPVTRFTITIPKSVRFGARGVHIDRLWRPLSPSPIIPPYNPKSGQRPSFPVRKHIHPDSREEGGTHPTVTNPATLPLPSVTWLWEPSPPSHPFSLIHLSDPRTPNS